MLKCFLVVSWTFEPLVQHLLMFESNASLPPFIVQKRGHYYMYILLVASTYHQANCPCSVTRLQSCRAISVHWHNDSSESCTHELSLAYMGGASGWGSSPPIAPEPIEPH